MGLIRGGIVLIVGLVLLASFVAMNTSLTLGLSLKYDSVKDGISETINQISQEIDLSTGINEKYDALNYSCFNEPTYYYVDKEENLNVNVPCSVISEGANNVSQFIIDSSFFEVNESKIINYVNSNFETISKTCVQGDSVVYSDEKSGYSFTVPCNVVSTGAEEVNNYAFNSLGEQIYYEKHDCGYWKCFTEENAGLFLISEQAHDYWMNKFYILLVFSLILCGLIFIFEEDKFGSLVTMAFILFLSSLPLLKIESIFRWIFDKPILDNYNFIPLMFNQAHYVFKLILYISIGLVILSFALKMGWHYHKKSSEKDEIKKVVKEEMKGKD